MKKKIPLILAFVFSVIISVFSKEITPSSNILYVKKDISGGDGSGSSWSNAIPELADALQWARQNYFGGSWDADNPLQIWVAKGTYKPFYPIDQNLTPVVPMQNSFVMLNNVQLYGGFAGDEARLEQRTNWKGNPTILSGELDTQYQETDPFTNQIITYNSVCHVVVAAGEVGSAVLDGFTVTSGNAAYPFSYARLNGELISGTYGGGISVKFSYPAIRNLVITGNAADIAGGGIHLQSDRSDEREIELFNVTLLGNTINESEPEAYRWGGGIYANRINLATYNCLLMGNVAERGGGFYMSGSYLSLVNTVVAGNKANTASDFGGGIFLYDSSLKMTNATINGNGGGAIYRDAGSITGIRNSIINNHALTASGLGEGVVRNSIVQFVTTDGGGNGTNLAGNTAPRFVNAPGYTTAPFVNGDYRLMSESPAIDKGDNDSYPGDERSDTDPAGMPRLAGMSIDMGAYEGGYNPLPVKLVSFEAMTEQHAVHLEWITVSEVNASHFEIHRRAEGSVFSAIGTVRAKGGGEDVTRYQITDYLPRSAGGPTYYRLKAIDKDGSYAWSGIIVVKQSRHDIAVGRIYPNPAHESVTVELGADYVGSRVKLLSTAGIVLQDLPVSDPTFFIRLEGYAPGIYWLQTLDGTVLKLLKK